MNKDLEVASTAQEVHPFVKHTEKKQSLPRILEMKDLLKRNSALIISKKEGLSANNNMVVVLITHLPYRRKSALDGSFSRL